MLVKICGITSLQDAEAAVDAGAAALGFVFWPKSPRYVDPHRARAIVSALPPFVVPVGVFVNQPADHKRLKDAIAGHRAKMAEESKVIDQNMSEVPPDAAPQADDNFIA